MIGRAQIVAEARRWVGTPYRHQARLMGLGVDCVGLIVGVGLDLGILDLDDEKFRPWENYARTPNPAKMRQGLEFFLDPIGESEALIGDICWLEWRAGLPMHLAILSDLDGRPAMIHAAGDIGSCVEHDLDAGWHDQIVSYWRYRGVAD